MQGFYNITERIRVQLAQDVFVNTITYGDIFRVDLKKQTIFPLSHVVVNNATMEGNVFRYNISVMAMDIVDISKDAIDNTALGQFRGNDNEQDVLNTQFAVIARLLKVLESGDLFTELYQLDGNPNIEPFTERFENYLAGWVATFDVLIPNDMTSCDAATIPINICDDATAITTDSLGNQLYSNAIPSGATETQVIQDSTYTVEYVNGTLIESGNILAEGSVTVQVANPIVCADATVNVNGAFWDTVPSGGTENVIVRQSSGSTQVGSIQGQYFRIADSTAVLKTTGGITISTTSIKAEDSEDIIAPDTTLEVNGVAEGTVVAGSTVDIQLSDSSGVVAPTSVTQVGNDFQVVLPDAVAPTGWIRPTGWLALDTVGVGTENFSGLFAVYETQKNVNTIQITTSGTNTINWGDGTTQVVTSGVLYTKVYDYSTIVSPVLVDEAGLNYKMVVVNINMTGVSILQIDRNTTATVIGNARNLGWLDIAVDCSTMTIFSPSGQGLAVLLQRLLIYNVGAFISGVPSFIQLAALKVLKFPFEKLQLSNITFINNLGDCRDENNLPLNINLTINTGSGFNLISNSHLTEIGNITAPLTNSFQNFLFNSVLLKKVGNINASSAANLFSTFSQCVKLTGVINVTTSPTLTSINGMINNCFLVDGLSISNCTNVTNTGNAVNACKNLKTLILTGLTRGITVDDCLMEATEINAFFTSLGTAVGSQTIFIRRNPGSATCDTTIATTKGFAVVIL